MAGAFLTWFLGFISDKFLVWIFSFHFGQWRFSVDVALLSAGLSLWVTNEALSWLLCFSLGLQDALSNTHQKILKKVFIIHKS